MTISAISSASSNPYYTDQNSARQAFGQLVSALQSGNLGAAPQTLNSPQQSHGAHHHHHRRRRAAADCVVLDVRHHDTAGCALSFKQHLQSRRDPLIRMGT
jgi:hypothetical protein